MITGLGTVTIYDHYWIRLSFSGSLTNGMTIDWMGNLFSDDNDLKGRFPDLVRSDTKDAWESGKTDWEEQHVLAARNIIQDLESRRALVHKGQILDRKDYIDASVFKVAEIAFRGMGRDFIDDRDNAKMNYEERLNNSAGKIDKDADGLTDRVELEKPQGRLTRGSVSRFARGFN